MWPGRVGVCKLSYARFRWNGAMPQFHRFYRVDSVKTVVKTAADAESLDPDCRCHYQKPLEWCYGAVSSFLANPPGLGEV